MQRLALVAAAVDRTLARGRSPAPRTEAEAIA
jgi:hypothetical protein